MNSYRLLEEQLSFNHELPVTPDWSASADFLFIIKEYCLNAKPGIIVECSSGLTTLILARCCQLNQRGKVFSLENGEEYLSQTQNNLNKFALQNYAELIHAPLVDTSINGNTYAWYDIDKLPDMHIDMLVIDGPPGFMQKHSRYPALPILLDRLADKSIIFMDDAARDDEKEIVQMWLNLDANIEHEYIETERGCSMLMIHRT